MDVLLRPGRDCSRGYAMNLDLTPCWLTAKNRITINLDENKHQKLVDLSNELYVSLAWLGRKAFAELLAKYSRELTGKENASTISAPINKLVSGS